jgi:amidase
MVAVPLITTVSGAAWQDIAVDRQKHRDATIAAVSPTLPNINHLPLNTVHLAMQVLTSEEIDITESSVEELIWKLARADISSVTVTNAFLRRAALAQVAVRIQNSIYLCKLINSNV